ncbi:MAG: ribosome biogenesis GTPase Der [Candidatus Omnitrophica bacterium]|nr:ribosome biogenesis GTPase Der [Candidatus Omnitrophota bacterium]
MSSVDNPELPRIAIIGRPNVGKSSIFNRMLKQRKAIVESVSGVTRDRLYARICLDEVDFVLIDTGGITPKSKEKIENLVYKQSREAIDESAAVIFTCDVTTGITYQDEYVASLLKKANKKTFLIINKVDGGKLKGDIFEFYGLGLGEPYALSALHNKGFDRLKQDVTRYILEEKKAHAGQGKLRGQLSSPAVKIAVVGRPNVGKSSFVNCIIDQDRLLVDEVPGTTRDSIDVYINRDKRPLMVVDTAGIRHKKKIKEVVEMFSLSRTKQAVKRCDVALIMIDATAGLFRDDISVIDYILKEGKPCILLVNKTDLVKDFDFPEYKKELIDRLNMMRWVPVISGSCKERKNIIKAMDLACEIAKKSQTIIPTSRLNALLKKLQRAKPHPSDGRFKPKIYYATQIERSPQTVVLFVTDPNRIKREYVKFIESTVRKEFGLGGVPIFFQLRKKQE